jgi:hypothetical protein
METESVGYNRNTEDIYFEELAHMTMEAEQFHDLPSIT